MTKSAFAPSPTQHIIAREGFLFIFLCLVPALLFALLGWLIPFLVMCALAGFVAYFFRNPTRVAPDDPQAVISPADGRIIVVQEMQTAPFIEGPGTKVSIFMSVLNVHINRMPMTARIRDVIYRPGKFMVASLDKASEHNERNVFILEGERGRTLAMAQIAGLIARRIVCYLRPGDTRPVGARVGLIRFGSRVDLYLPQSHAHTIDVHVGDRVKAGESIIGRWA
jgi:phosphatidylserine decarboxylase